MSMWQRLKRGSVEIKIVLVTLAVLIMLPITTVVVMAASGLSVLSDALARINPITHLVEIFDANGKKVRDVELSTTWPTTGYISDEFGAHEAFRKLFGLGVHTGIDIANEHGQVGTPVTTFMDGTVTIVDNTDNSDCGISVTVDHGSGVSSLYCHLETTNTTVGTPVVPGDVIGYMGMSGTATGPHLHFTVMVYGIPVNPRMFMVGEPSGTY